MFYEDYFSPAIEEFNSSRDVSKAIRLLNSFEFVHENLEISREVIRTKLEFIGYLQEKIAELAYEDLPRAKELLELLTCEDHNIILVFEYLKDKVDYFLILNLEASLRDKLLDLITKDEMDNSELTERLFSSLPVFPVPSSTLYTDQIMQEIIDLVNLKEFDKAFSKLITVEAIPNNLHASRMHKPLLQKYLWSALCGYEELCEKKIKLASIEEPIFDSISELHHHTSLLKFAFGPTVASQLEICIKQIM